MIRTAAGVVLSMVGAFFALSRAGSAAPLFTGDERRAVVAYWNAPDRYVVEPSPDATLTPEGKAWTEGARRALPWRDRAAFDAWLRQRQVYETFVRDAPPDAVLPAPVPPPAGCENAPPTLYTAERVNVTVPGSVWHWNYARIPADKKAAPDTGEWEPWVTRRVAYDKALATGNGATAREPGPIPVSLRDALGEPPTLFARVRPTRYTVTFDPADAAAPFVYTDTIPFADRYQYYRSANGIVRYGKPLKNYAPDEVRRLDVLWAKVGRDPFERRVIQAVSRLEGGFEAVNTYDTGFVSIGFIQFITAQNGDGSLAHVLLRHKADDPADFQSTFRRFGLDVAPEAVVVAVDPQTGDELRGTAAVRKIIDDKRLSAVFERAGHLDGFRLAQVRVARDRYWPGDDVLTVPITTVYEQSASDAKPKPLVIVYGAADTVAQTALAAQRQAERQRTDPSYRSWVDMKPVSGTVASFIRSEAGMATLMDRKVNRGNIRPLEDLAVKRMREGKLTKIDSLRFYERELVAAMKFRHDFLSDPSLSQPK